jgi:hypothetical protein
MRHKLALNNLLFFRYKAIGEGTLPFYDKTPLALVLDIRLNNVLCLNMHWIKPRDRAEFFNDIREIMNKTISIGKRKERQRLTYQLLKKPKYRIGLDAIRMYYFSGISQLKIIPEPQWTILFGYGISQYKKRIVYKKDDYKD